MGAGRFRGVRNVETLALKALVLDRRVAMLQVRRTALYSADVGGYREKMKSLVSLQCLGGFEKSLLCATPGRIR